MREYIKKKVVIEKEVAEKITCDICNKIIKKENQYSISASHDERGNDSIESYVTYDFCSIGCLYSIVKERPGDIYCNQDSGAINSSELGSNFYSRVLKELVDYVEAKAKNE